MAKAYQDDEQFLRRTFELARLGEGKVSPNPMVGAVIVKNNKIIAEGFHRRHGTDHAERRAILKLAQGGKIKNCAAGCTLYVSLEPCNHHGRTPPCTDLIIEAGIKRVVFAIKDPNPKVVRGNTVRKLTQAGIKVVSGLLSEEAKELNKIFIKNQLMRKPYFILKTATSLDGKIATRTGESRWITSELSRKIVHELRYMVDAVLVGINTVVQDDPRLTIRWGKQDKQIWRIILDTRGRIPRSSRVVTNPDKKTILVVSDRLATRKIANLQKLGLHVFPVPVKQGQINLSKLSEILYKKNICSVLVEGGSAVNASFMNSGLLDEFYCFLSPKVIGGENAPGPVGGKGEATVAVAKRAHITEIKMVGEDVLIRGNFSRNWY